MTRADGGRRHEGALDAVAPATHWARWRARVRYGIPLRAKLILPVFGIACLAVGALFAFSYLTLQSSVASIYEGRARSVAALISKSIQEKDYILYYSEALDRDIARLVEQHESILGLSVIGATARGYVTVASTDPTRVGEAATAEDSSVYDALRGVSVQRVSVGVGRALRATYPIASGADRAGVLVLDMSLDEQAGYVRRLGWQFGLAAGAAVLVLCALLAVVLTGVVTRPVRRLAVATGAVAERTYQASPEFLAGRVPGVRTRDEMWQFRDGFESMVARIHAHEQELRRLVVLDEVTGVYNAAHFREQFPIEISKGRRYGHPTSLLVVELEGLTGQDPAEQDKARARAASFLLANLRRVDTVYRTARDRFVAVLPETPATGAKVAGDRTRAYVADVLATSPFPLRVSVAVMGWAHDDDVPSDDLVCRLTRDDEASSG